MKKFENLKEYTSDELILIVYQDFDDWQTEAVLYAKDLLKKRGISENSSQIRLKEILEENELLWRKELEEREIESYHIIAIFLMALLWFKHIFKDWHLGRDGYIKMRKQRLYSIGGGIIFYMIIILFSSLEFDKNEQLRINNIDQSAVTDSIAKSKIDWSGAYIFNDTGSDQKHRLIWELIVSKNQNEHKATLNLIKEDETFIIVCIGLIKNKNLEIFPDSTYMVFNNQKISYYDRLFTLVRDDNDIYTRWDILSPFYHSKNNGYRLFKIKNSS